MVGVLSDENFTVSPTVGWERFSIEIYLSCRIPDHVASIHINGTRMSIRLRDASVEEGIAAMCGVGG